MTPFCLDLIRETWRGKTIGRILLNQILREHVGALQGTVLDIAGGSSSYERYVDLRAAKLVTTNIDPVRRPMVVHDFNTPLPFENESMDSVLTINSLYIVRDPAALAREVQRVLKPSGSWYVISPFVFGVTTEPEDYERFTDDGLRRIMNSASLEVVQLIPVGGRAVAALNLVDMIVPFALPKFLARVLALMVDATVLKKINRLNPAPSAFFVEARKPS
jgi:SAM-dependent methyltransferase